MILFDLDGTVLDTLDDLTDAVNHTMKAMGFPSHTREAVRSFVGGGVPLLIRRALPDGVGEAVRTEAYDRFTRYYKAHSADKTRPYDGILPLLQRLKRDGHKLAVVSNKDDYAVAALCEAYFPGMFDVAIGARPEFEKKPAPDSLLYALERLGGTPSEALYIGDSEVDLQTAENASMPCISVTWGFRDETFLRAHGATTLCHTAEGLYESV